MSTNATDSASNRITATNVNMRGVPCHREAVAGTLETELAALSSHPRTALVERWVETYGNPPPKGTSRRLLEYAAAYRVQSQALGGLKPAVRHKLGQQGVSDQPPASPATKSKAPKTLPPGSRLVREWHGIIHTVDVLADDRLTRSLADFAKIVEVFDGHGVSFVSVTQQFNTTTSMGRLTLNMLLSFAQFEREVTGERIRDKIAASKKKGMWMGGPPPLGYDIKDRKLVINQPEAEIVRTLFLLYLEHGTARALRDEASRRGLTTKRRCRADGRETGGKPFTRGNLYNLLANPLYIGQVSHKGTLYPGQHEAIVDRETFEAVGRQLTKNVAGRRLATNAKAPSLLSGLVYDDTGDRLCPTHTNKKGRRYRYYISKRLMDGTDDESDGWRVPADALENTVLRAVETLLQDEHRIVEELQDAGIPIERIRSVVSNRVTLPAALEDKQVLHNLLRRVTLGPKSIRLEIDRSELVGLIAGVDPGSVNVMDKVLEHVVPIRLQRRGVEAKLVVRGRGETEARVDPKLVAYVARGHRWFDELAGGTIGSVIEIAARDGVDSSDVGRGLQLAFLAPDIVEAILNGRQPVELTTRRLRRIGTLPMGWKSQRHRLGFET